MYVYEYCRKTNVYLPLLRVTDIFNLPRNVNLRDFTSFLTNFLDFRFRLYTGQTVQLICPGAEPKNLQ